MARARAAAGVRRDHGRAEGIAACGIRGRRAGCARGAGCRDETRGMGALQHAGSRGSRVRRGVPAGVLADDSTPRRIGPPYTFGSIVSLSTTLLTPFVSFAIRTASAFSAALRTGPVSVTMPLFVSTSIFKPPTVVSARNLVLTAAVMAASVVASFTFSPAP